MFYTNLLLAIVGSFLLTLIPQIGYATPKKPPSTTCSNTTTIMLYEGGVDESSGGRFLNVITDNIDKVTGLKLMVDFAPDEKSHLTIFDGKPLNISWRGDGEPDMEVLVNGDIVTTNYGYLVDGFYLVKSGGQHAGGALSYGLIPVDEAMIRLNSNVKIVERPF